MRPLYSVLISNYNNGKYIDEAIQSVINQTYTNWEIIIVDDCSNDNSFEVYNKYQTNSKIRIYQNKKNYGRGYTKQKCFNFSEGDICSFLDADDKLELNALERMIEMHMKYPSCSLIYSTHYNFENSGLIDISKNNGELGELNDFAITSSNIISHLVSFKRKSFLKTKGIASINMADDVDLYLKLEEVGDVKFIDEPLYYYRTDNVISACRTIETSNSNYITSKVFLNAYYRRISSKSALFTKKKQLYYNALDYWFQVYLKNSFGRNFDMIRYLIVYLICTKFRFSSFVKISKLFFNN